MNYIINTYFILFSSYNMFIFIQIIMWKVIESNRKKSIIVKFVPVFDLKKRKYNKTFLLLQTNVNNSKESNHYNQLWLLNYDYSMPDNNEYSMSNESFSPVTLANVK